MNVQLAMERTVEVASGSFDDVALRTNLCSFLRRLTNAKSVNIILDVDMVPAFRLRPFQELLGKFNASPRMILRPAEGASFSFSRVMSNGAPANVVQLQSLCFFCKSSNLILRLAFLSLRFCSVA